MSILTKLLHLSEKFSGENGKDYRFIPFVAILLTFTVFLCGEYFLGTYSAVAQYMSIRPMPYFHDLGIWVCGIEAMREGLDPYVVGCDNAKSYFNYPSLWVLFSYVPFITKSNLVAMGLVQLSLFCTSLFFFVGRLNLFAAIIYALLFLSPAVLVAMERGNCDIIIFLFLMMVIFAYRTRYQHAGLLLFSAMLKLYPAGAFLALLNLPRYSVKRRLYILLFISFCFLCYLVLQADNLRIVNQQTPRPFGKQTFGLGEIPAALVRYFSISADGFRVSIYLGFFVLMFLLSYLLLFRRTIAHQVNESKTGFAYLVGSGVFLVACAFGFNFGYRLVFLLFTIPQLLNWLRDGSLFAATLLYLSVFIVWQQFIDDMLKAIGLDFLHYHYINQLFVAILFFGHLKIAYHFLLSRYLDLRFN